MILSPFASKEHHDNYILILFMQACWSLTVNLPFTGFSFKTEMTSFYSIVLIPLETVRKEWMAKNEFSTTTKLAKHYGIFEHMFQKKEFVSSVRMSVKFGNTDQVHYGNFLTPSQVHVHVQCGVVIILSSGMVSIQLL